MVPITPPKHRDLPDTLQSQRLLLRPYRPGDGPDLFAAVSEDRPRLRRWLPWTGEHTSPQASEAAIQRLSDRWQTREDLAMGLWERSTTRLLGGCGLHRIDWDLPSFEIGYWLRRTAEGRGYMTEAVRLLCSLTCETLGASRVVIRCDRDNLRSAAIPKRLGFREEEPICEQLIFVLTPEAYAKWEK